MKFTFDVPESAKRAAQRALGLQKVSPLPETGGMSVAETLATGTATLDVVGRIHRFFQVNARSYASEAQGLRTELDSPLVRTWHLYGAESAQRWAAGLYKQAIAEGFQPADALTDLFTRQPEEIYAAFSIGAWRFEYDLNPRKAARFVEEYHRATGWNLELYRAFGDSARAVGTALHRRFHPVDPFKEAARCLTVEDVEYRLAAQVDLAELTHSVDALEEGLKPTVFVAPAATTAKMVWPAFVAYVILAAERPDLVAAMNKSSQKPPLIEQKPKSYLQYHDAINTFVAFFHPQGSRFVDPMKSTETNAKAFGSLSDEMSDLMQRAYFGKHISPTMAQKLLGKARRWTAENKFAGSLFHVFNADWKKGNWQHVLDHIPEDADVRPYFQEFVKENPMPAGGVKLQQTLSDKGLKQDVATYLAKEGFIEDASVDFLDAVKVDDTEAGTAFNEIGTPLGVYSVIDYKGESFDVLGAFRTKGKFVRFVFRRSGTQELTHSTDATFASAVKQKLTTVVLAHKDMPGSAYGAKKPVSPQPATQEYDPVTGTVKVIPPTSAEIPSPSINPLPPVLQQYLVKGGYADKIELPLVSEIDIAKTEFGIAAKKKYGKSPRAKQLWTRTNLVGTETTYTVVGAFEWGGPTRIILQNTGTYGPDYFIAFDDSTANYVNQGTLYPAPALPASGDLPDADKDADGFAEFSKQMSWAAAALAKVTPTPAKYWIATSAAHTQWADVVKTEFNDTPVFGQMWTRDGAELMLIGALTNKKSSVMIVFQVPKISGAKGIITVMDGHAAKLSQAHILQPAYLKTPTKNIVTQIPEPVAPKQEADPFAFHTNDIVEWSGTNWLVLATVEKSGTPPYYIALELVLNDLAESANVPTQILKSTLDKVGKYKTGVAAHPLVLADYIKLPAHLVQPSSNVQNKLGELKYTPIGGKVIDEKQSWTVLRYLKDTQQDALGMLRAAPAVIAVSGTTVDSWNFGFKTMAAMSVFTTSYAPPVMAPELPSEDDEPDAEQGEPAMSGTDQAFEFMANKGWTPAIASESPLFKFPLGGRQFYHPKKSRLIIGYALDSGGTPVYVHVTEVGNVGWVTCINAHSKYGPLDKMVQGVVDDLKPKPGTKKAIFPKLNYKLSAKAKEIAQATGQIFVPAPKLALFYVNTPLAGAGKDKVVLIGWVNAPGASGDAYLKTASKPWAVLYNEEGKDPLATYLTSVKGLNDDYSLRYEHSTQKLDNGELIFGKKPGQDEFIILLNGQGIIPAEPEDGWDDPVLLKQPPTPVVDKGKHAAAGIIAIIPPNAGIVSQSGTSSAAQYPMIALYHPLGHYGGYKLNIPKGTVDKGESLLKTAVREFHEETGLTAKAVSYLGDFRGNQSLTRLYIGYVTGGNPYKKKQPEECDSVTFKPLSPDYKSEKWYAQLVPASGNKWQQDAVDAAVAWMAANGLPQKFTPETETEDAAVSLESDVPDPFGHLAKGFAALATAAQKSGEAILTAAQAFGSLIPPPPPAGWAPSVPPSDLDADDPWKALLFKVDFPITGTMVDVLKNKVKLHIAATPVSFNCARSRSVGPKYGEAFETSAGTPYVAAGYVSWEGEDGALYNYLLVMTTAGSVEALPAHEFGLKDAKVSSDQSFTTGSKDAWYTHPDPKVNATIQSVYQTGTLDGTGVNMKTFKESWMKAAGVPAYAVITGNMVRDVASLFVPGACPQVLRDAILLCLKSRMKATHSGKKGKSTPTTMSPSDSVASVPLSPIKAPPAPSTTVLSTGPLSSILKQYVEHPQPHLFGLADAAPKTITASSKPSAILSGPGGKQWFAKWAVGEDFRPYVDRAAYQIAELCKPNNIPVGVMEFSGKTVSYQPFAADGKPPPADPSELDEQNMAELLSQHAVDMFMGDHDGNVTNWISVGGRLIAVDRGQAFKFLMLGQAESLDPNFHAPGNFGKGYAKTLLLQWSKGEIEIPESAWIAMLKSIRGVAKITNVQLEAILTPVFDAAKSNLNKRLSVVSALVSRRDNYEKDWTTTLRKLRKSFKWPSVSVSAAPTKVFTSSPKDVGFGKAQEKTIAEAVAAKWQGKALQIGGLAFENQEVMVRRVIYEEKPGLKVPATLIHFRLARPAGIEAATKLYKSSNLEITETLGGPQRLKADHAGNYWEKIYAAVKTLNHHLYKQKDTEVNLQTIGAMSALRPVLNGLLKTAADASGTYAQTNEPNEAVYAMAEQYLQYLGIVEYWVSNKEEFVGQHSPTLVEFLWEPPVPEHAVQGEAPPYKISLKKQGALWPTAVPVGQDVHVTNLNKPVMNSAYQSQFVIEDPLTKARIFWNPPGGMTDKGLDAVKDGVESLKGQGWAIVPGEPTTATVAHLLKLFSDATGIAAQAADEQDAEALYWSKQANALQNGGSVKPKADHTTVIDPSYAKALEVYGQGNRPQAVARLKAFVASKLGKTIEETEALATPADIRGKYTRGAGFYRHERIGWTRESLQKTMGKECRLGHHLSDTPTAWMQAMQNNGALLSNAIKAFYGVTKTGASPGQDMSMGGGQGLFLCFRKGFAESSGMIYFDISLALRLDVYIVGTGDSYGGTDKERYMTPETWVSLGANTKTGYCGASSPLQVNIRHDIDIREYLVAVMCGSASDRAQCVKIAKSLGWTFYGGASPEDVFRTS